MIVLDTNSEEQCLGMTMALCVRACVCVLDNLPLLGAFIIPNKPIKGETSLTKYQVPLRELEKHLGTKLIPRLTPEKVVMEEVNVHIDY